MEQIILERIDHSMKYMAVKEATIGTIWWLVTTLTNIM